MKKYIVGNPGTVIVGALIVILISMMMVSMVAKDATTLDKTVAADVPLEQHQHADHTVLEDNRAISS